MTTGEKLGIGVALLLLFWPWKEQVTTTVGPPTDYGPLPGPCDISCDLDQCYSSCDPLSGYTSDGRHWIYGTPFTPATRSIDSSNKFQEY